MTRRPIHSLAPRPSPLAPRAFTFIEVLFAIIILGIGSIMIAGMLPVAIKQSSDTRNAITGKAACEAGFAYLQALAVASSQYVMPDSNSVDMSATLYTGLGTSAGRIVPLSFNVIQNNLVAGAYPGPLSGLQSITGNRVLASDTRTQWLAFYGRTPLAGTAKLIVLATHLNNTESTSGYITGPTAPTPVNTLTLPDNGPFLLTAAFAEGGALDPDQVTLTGTTQTIAAAETNAFVIVADSPVVGTDSDRPYRNNGRVFRLGKFVSGTTTTATYELQPGYDLPPLNLGPDNLPNTPDDVADASMDNTTATQVWLVGKGLANPTIAYTASSNPYVGLAQDVGVLTTQIQLSN